MLNLGVLVSGRGSNLQAILDAVSAKKIPAVVSVVVSNKDCPALERARKAGVPAVFIDAKGKTREEFDELVLSELKKHGVELVVFAGYFRLVSKKFVDSYRNKIINIHPSLLPAFPGGLSDAQKRALEWGVKISGCTVHFVDEGEDTGAIIVQKAVEVKDDDSADSLSARILEKEHEALPEAIKLIAEGRVKIRGRRVVIE